MENIIVEIFEFNAQNFLLLANEFYFIPLNFGFSKQKNKISHSKISYFNIKSSKFK